MSKSLPIVTVAYVDSLVSHFTLLNLLFYLSFTEKNESSYTKSYDMKYILRP